MSRQVAPFMTKPTVPEAHTDTQALARLVELLALQADGVDLGSSQLKKMNALLDTFEPLLSRINSRPYESAQNCKAELDSLVDEFALDTHHRSIVTQGRPAVEQCLATLEQVKNVRPVNGAMTAKTNAAICLFVSTLSYIFWDA